MNLKEIIYSCLHRKIYRGEFGSTILALKFGFLNIILVKIRLLWNLGWSKTGKTQGHEWVHHLRY